MPVAHVKFASEEAPGTKVTAKTVKEAIAALKKARKEVQGLEKDERYRDFKLVLTDDAKRAGGDGTIDALADSEALVSGGAYTAHLVREYPLRVSKHPARKYIVGRFKGQRTPTFTGGENAPVDWQMRPSKSAVHGNVISLSGGKKTNKGTYTGTKDGQGAAYFMLTAKDDGLLGEPCEEWYTFSHNVQRRVFTLEEAEAKMEAGKRVVGEAWGRMDRSVEELGYSDDDSGGDKGDQREYSSDEEDAFKAKKGKKKAIPGMEVDSDDEDAKAGKKSGKSKEDAGREDWEHDAEWDDDEDEVAIPEGEDAPKDPTKTHGDSDGEEEGLDKEGLAVKKLLGKQEKMQAGQFSDSDSDSELEEDFNPDKDVIGKNVVGSFVERSKKLEEEEKAEAAAAATKSTPASATGVKRSASEAGVGEGAAGASAAKAARVATPAPKHTPIEATIIDVIRKNPESTSVKLITKMCRKKGLLNSTAGTEELKKAISSMLVMKKLRDGSHTLVLK